MNDLGLSLAWSAVQVSLVMVPAMVLHAWASRHSAASGAWMAALGLALSVAITVVIFLPWPQGGVGAQGPLPASGTTKRVKEVSRDATAKVADLHGARFVPGADQRSAELSLSFTAIRGVLSRLERGTAEPLVRFRRWGSALAAAIFTGAGIGLLRLFLGMWAVRLCRRRGTIISDQALIDLLQELRVGTGCNQDVEIRQVPDLVTPATAGWRHPVIFLPYYWRTWDDVTRRAVLAHELAHIQRRDYVTGFVARLAVALHFYHPLIWWLAGRLLLQQELAADAVGARLAGGRSMYLLALSRLALRQDGQSPFWPARAFLPRGGP